MLRALLWLLLATGTARAEPRRVVISQSPAVGLQALAAHVQLHGGPIEIVELAATAEPVGPRTAELLARHAATAIVWLEPAGDDRATLIAWLAIDRSRHELVRVDAAAPRSEIERIVALKLVAALELHAPRTAVAPPPEPKRWRFGIGAGLVAGDDRGVAAGPAFALTHRQTAGSWIVSGDVRARWFRSGAIEAGPASASVDEAALAVQLELARALGRFEPFAAGGLTGSLYRATGEAMDGRSGSATEVVPGAYLHVGLRIEIAPAVIAVEAGLEHAWIQQRFLVGGAVVADLQRTRGVGALWLAIPFR